MQLTNLKSVRSIVTPGKAPVELDLSAFLYEAIDATDFIDVKNWMPSFDAIPVDPYIKEGYRYKSIGWFRVKHQKVAAVAEIDEHIKTVNKLSGLNETESSRYLSVSPSAWHSDETGYSCWNLPQYAMQQSILYNPVHGGMRREYPSIGADITNSDDFRKLIIQYATFFGWGDAIVLVQFQRVDCNISRTGLPAVEGFHQDGNRHVAMPVVNRNNVATDSGVSQYVLDDNGKKTDELIFDAVVPAGQLIFWNDKRVWHYGTEIKVADANANGGRGTRDIIILSAKIPPANIPMGQVPEKFR